ncbi:hypothetical protein DL89DRAFT_268452, partial [Linderina pennispora]
MLVGNQYGAALKFVVAYVLSVTVFLLHGLHFTQCLRVPSLSPHFHTWLLARPSPARLAAACVYQTLVRGTGCRLSLGDGQRLCDHSIVRAHWRVVHPSPLFFSFFVTDANRKRRAPRL